MITSSGPYPFSVTSMTWIRVGVSTGSMNSSNSRYSMSSGSSISTTGRVTCVKSICPGCCAARLRPPNSRPTRMHPIVVARAIAYPLPRRKCPIGVTKLPRPLEIAGAPIQSHEQAVEVSLLLQVQLIDPFQRQRGLREGGLGVAAQQ